MEQPRPYNNWDPNLKETSVDWMLENLSRCEHRCNKPETLTSFEKDYEMHLRKENDYLFVQSSPIFQTTDIQLLRNQCEGELKI